MINSTCAQKYYDAPVLLFLIFQSRGDARRVPGQRAALGGLMLLFCAYFAFSAAAPTPPARRSGAPAPADAVSP